MALFYCKIPSEVPWLGFYEGGGQVVLNLLAPVSCFASYISFVLFFFFFWWGLLHGPQQGPDRMKEKKPIRLGKGKLLPKQKNPP